MYLNNSCNSSLIRVIMLQSVKYIAVLVISLALSQAQAQPRQTLDFNSNWKFYLGNDSTATNASFNDAKWRTLTLPHDWSIEQPFDEKAPATTQGGALPGGIGWYRKTFTLPANSKDKKIYIEFDGIYRNSEVWINGIRLGKRPNGYISFRYDLTDHLHEAPKRNVLVVKVDNSQQPNSRWYTGSGIYRNTRLVITSETAIDQWGTFVTTPAVSAAQATVNIAVTIRKVPSRQGAINLLTHILDASGKVVASESQRVLLPRNAPAVITHQQIVVKAPQLWSVEQPNLYKAVTKVVSPGKTVDEYTTTFGIRSFRFDADKGFFLNEKPLKILGVCMHHDLGALGVAVNVSAMRRQLQIMKDMGANAIRTAHNPPAPELLDLCDQMGLLVIDEAFDMWRKKKNKFDYFADFPEWHEKDLQDQVLRDRNHPSVFMWSIGNEIREQFDSTGLTITRELVDIVKELDTTRPVTAALSESNPDKNFMYKSGALDIIGLNYHHEVYADFQKNYPGKVFLGTENMSALASRGHYDMPSDSTKFWPQKSPMKYVEGGNPDYTVSAYDQVAAYWGSTHETTWKIIKKYDFLSGLFVWTGFDYLGEPTPYPWPARSSYFGIVDLAGFPKDVYYMYQSEWTTKPVLHIFPHWNWQPGKVVDVWAYYNNADEVELFLNDRSLGTKHKQGDDLHVMWQVPFEAGTLKAISRKAGKTMLEKEIKTAGSAYRLELVPDRKIIHANGKDLVFVTIRVLDTKSRIVPDADPLIKVKITGNATLAGMDNGYPASLESFKGNQHKAYKGLCLAIVQAGGQPGPLKIEVSATGLQPASVTLQTIR
jgi:beta-galactosidase